MTATSGPDHQVHSSEMRAIPSVDALVQKAVETGIFQREVPRLRVHLARSVLRNIRAAVQSGALAPSPEAVLVLLRDSTLRFWERRIRRVINATGIPLHTNLGRAPLDADSLARVVHLAQGYCDLEYDIEGGKRGSRGAWVNETLAVLTGAEAAIVVNNGAAALLLALAALSDGRETIVSRGELVQVGGGFRIPDVMEASGARIHEVGSTNITTIKDYEKSTWEQTALLLKVHRSNFFIQGHVEEASLREMHELAARRKVSVVYDLGSGCLVRPEGALDGELSVADAIHQGADLVTFSGDKLAGSAQAGMIVGRADLIKLLATHPLYRALRPGRLVLCTLQESLELYCTGSESRIPVMGMLRQTESALAERTRHLASLLTGAGVAVTIRNDAATIGGGAAPESRLPGDVVVVCPPDLADFLARLRTGKTPVVARVSGGEVLIDPRTVMMDEEAALVDAVVGAWKRL